MCRELRFHKTKRGGEVPHAFSSTPKGGRRLAHHTPLLKIPVWWRRAVLPSLPWAARFLSFFTPFLPRLLPSLPWVVCFLSFFLTPFLSFFYSAGGLLRGLLIQTFYSNKISPDRLLPRHPPRTVNRARTESGEPALNRRFANWVRENWFVNRPHQVRAVIN